MSRCLNGEASAADENELELLMQADESVRQQYNTMRALWRSTAPDTFQDNIHTREEVNVARILQLARVEEAVAAPVVPAKRIWLTPQRVAVMVAAASVLLIAAYWQLVYRSGDRRVQVIVAQNGSRMQSKLPDGSTVWLNAGSSISYPVNFTGSQREVELKGEGYFDVAKNAGKPFIVHTAGIDIKVLGTAFNVKAYDTDKEVETTLISGMVQISRSGKGQQATPIVLHPDEKLVIPRKKVMATAQKSAAVAPVTEEDLQLADSKIMHINTQLPSAELAETAWMHNRLVFKGESFGELAPKLERWYDIAIEFTAPSLQALRFNGSFENETVEQAFDALATAVPFRFQIQGHKVLVMADK
ncbi:FecR family protein [Filimonas lacunae]|nr:FecR domain-containing protein [Filimonas lacunae]BAV04327.1 anti-sigma factor [Filimonas lacunae]